MNQLSGSIHTTLEQQSPNALTRVFDWLTGKGKEDAKLDSLNLYGYSPAL